MLIDRYSRELNGGELWAKIEVLANALTPLYKKQFKYKGEIKNEL